MLILGSSVSLYTERYEYYESTTNGQASTDSEQTSCAST